MKLQKSILAGVLALVLLCTPCLAATGPTYGDPPGVLVMASLPEPVDDTAVSAAPTEEPAGYTLTVDDEIMTIEGDATPLAAAPTQENCCALHLLLMVAALGVTVCYVCNRKRSQAEEFKLRCDLLD